MARDQEREQAIVLGGLIFPHSLDGIGAGVKKCVSINTSSYSTMMVSRRGTKMTATLKFKAKREMEEEYELREHVYHGLTPNRY